MGIVSDRQIVAIHTVTGTPVWQLLASGYTKLKWTRALREVSMCDVTVPVGIAGVPDIVACLHWVSVWDEHGREMYWRGPIQRRERGRTWLHIAAGDPASLLREGTRCPITKRWESADPADIAAELFGAAIELHSLNLRVVVRPDPRGQRFDFNCVADDEMLTDTIGRLEGLGLYWTVAAGTLYLGPQPFEPVTALGEDHFVDGDPILIRDGTKMFNDVLLRAGDHVSRARVPMAGVTRQTIVRRDSMFGVSNADRAAQEAARYLGKVRDAVSVAPGTSLDPAAPISIAQMIPSARVNVEAYGQLSPNELDSVTVTVEKGVATVGIDLEPVNDDLPELVKPGPGQTL
ncbi:hypothetical protein H7I53_17880 [Mycolicibacterium pulveris]|uniref:Minor tail protein n=1 Tax=Mycolicibacterium pulveris TaxID=36813 RepID=A0A7I7UC09_MYCPV|nr:hypothetical protein [Mycolicibacterium pulveris]MCV6982087.1 hypothetical protein [Mycolicibacterium pulveris]BBY78872.1 hypothetical protein MPUL_00300 [Mycolicibacterium pulveris]